MANNKGAFRVMDNKTPEKEIKNSELFENGSAAVAAPAPNATQAPQGQEPAAGETSTSEKPQEKQPDTTISARPSTTGTENKPAINPWEKERRPWASTVDGRFAIRTISRGVMGAAFFAIGGIMTNRMLRNYDPAMSLKEQAFGEGGNFMKVIAKSIDTVVGKPIETVFGRDAVTFRETRAFEKTRMGADGKPVHGHVWGRSLGDEAVAITFDFAMASVGDAWARNIAGVFDPNVKKRWLDDKGHVHFPELIQDTLKSTWKILSYNQAEDWAVAIPYAYQMKFQRKALDHLFPGFRYDFDRQANGGSVRINHDGKITGDYSLAGALDLQIRFTGYNIGTMVYREAYNKVAEKLQDWKEGHYKMPEIHVKSPGALMRDFDDKAGELGQYLTKSAIKATIFMTPSVPFFWMFRTPQSKFRGIAINPEYDGGPHQREAGAVLAHMRDGNTYQTEMVAQGGRRLFDVQAHDLFSDIKKTRPFGYLTRTQEVGTFVPDLKVTNANIGAPFYNYGTEKVYNPFERTHSAMDEMLNPLGRLSNATADRYEKGLMHVGHAVGYVPDAGVGGANGPGNAAREQLVSSRKKNIQDFSRMHMNAAFAYTPYMYAKAEFANVWDNVHMDKAINEALDGAFSGNRRRFKEGVHEVRLALTKDLPDKKDWREVVAKDLDDNKKVDIQSMSQSERVRGLKPKEPKKQQPTTWIESEKQRSSDRDNNPPSGVTIH